MAGRLSEDERAMYEAFASQFPICFWCRGMGAKERGGIAGRLVNAHLVGGPGRRHDRRAIIRLHDECHRLSHGERIVRHGQVLPTIDLGGMLWLKRHHDPDWFDLDYLDSISTRRIDRDLILPPIGWR